MKKEMADKRGHLCFSSFPDLSSNRSPSKTSGAFLTLVSVILLPKNTRKAKYFRPISKKR